MFGQGFSLCVRSFAECNAASASAAAAVDPCRWRYGTGAVWQLHRFIPLFQSYAFLVYVPLPFLRVSVVLAKAPTSST